MNAPVARTALGRRPAVGTALCYGRSPPAPSDPPVSATSGIAVAEPLGPEIAIRASLQITVPGDVIEHGRWQHGDVLAFRHRSAPGGAASCFQLVPSPREASRRHSRVCLRARRQMTLPIFVVLALRADVGIRLRFLAYSAGVYLVRSDTAGPEPELGGSATRSSSSTAECAP